MFRIEEQFIHVTHLVNGNAFGSAHQVIKILKSVLRSETDVMETKYAPCVTIDHSFLESRKFRVDKGIQHRDFSAWKRNISKWYTLWRHMNHGYMMIAMESLFSHLSNPANCVV